MSKRLSFVVTATLLGVLAITCLGALPLASAAAPHGGRHVPLGSAADGAPALPFFNRVWPHAGTLAAARAHGARHRRPRTGQAVSMPGDLLPTVNARRLIGYFERLLHRLVGRHLRRAIVRRAGLAPAVSAPKLELLGLINAERERAGEAPLHLSALLDAIAQQRSQDMTNRHYFSHLIPGVGYVFTLLDRHHLAYQMAGENIALNNYIEFYNLVTTVRDTNQDFMNSPEHRANILEPRYSEVGLGMAFQRKTGQLIVTEEFVQP